MLTVQSVTIMRRLRQFLLWQCSTALLWVFQTITDPQVLSGKPVVCDKFDRAVCCRTHVARWVSTVATRKSVEGDSMAEVRCLS